MDDECRSLMTRYQAGEAQAFEMLYCRLAPELRRLACLLAPATRVDDALIDAIFLDIHHARRSYHPRNPFEPWLTAIVRHRVTGHEDGRLRTTARRGRLRAAVRSWFSPTESA